MMLRYFTREEGRENVRQMHLIRALEIPLGELEVLAHDTEVHALGAQNVTNLPQHFIDSHVGPHVARAVVSSEQKLQLFARLPRLPCSEHPACPGPFD